MTTAEFKKIARLLKQVYQALEAEAMKAGISLTSDVYDKLIYNARLKILENEGFTLEQYREAKAKVSGFSQADLVDNVEQRDATIKELGDRHIPTSEEIAQIAEEVAQKYIVPPQITNQIIERIIEKRPIKETIKIKERVEYDDKPIRKEIKRVIQQIDEIKIPEQISIEKLKKELNSDFSVFFEHNINTLNMPNFRKLAMGLQGQIDELNNNPTASAFTDLTDVPANYTGSAGKAAVVNGTEDGLVFSTISGTDEKVKYDASDPTAGYVADKIIAGTGISVAEGAGANENKLVVTNSAPDQTVAITDSGVAVVTGTYPNFDINVPDQTYTLPTSSTTVLGGVKIDGTTITIASGVISAVAGGAGTVTSVAAITLGTTGTDLSSTVATGTTTPVITLQVPTASASNRGVLSSTDWSTFNSKAPALGADDNYVTDAEKVVIGNTSGTNSGNNAANTTYTIGSQTQAYNANLTAINQALTTTSSPSFTAVGATTFTGALTGTASGNLTSANIEDSIVDAHTTIAPSGNAVFDALALKAPLASPTFTSTPSAPTATPGTSTTQLATTEFVQVAVRSSPGKEASEYATIAALPTVVYNNGTAGVGATLTGVAFGAIGVDSQTPVVGNRLLVKNQVSTFQNGIYTVTIVGTAGTVFVLTRALDFNQQTDVLTGAATYVVGGTTLAGTTWDVNSADSPVIGTDAITFVQSAGPGSVVQGNGITITGTSIAINTAVTADLTSTQTMTGKTIDGVTPTVMGYVDPTSSIQTQLNGKQASGAYLTTVDISANTNLAVTAPIVLTGDTLSIPAATASVNGYATSTQITKLDGIATSATANAKITGATLDTLTDDTGFVTAKAVQDGHNVPHAAPGTTGNLLQSNGTDWLAVAVPTWNQNTSGTASNVSGTPALPNGTTATTQAANDNSTKLATTAYADLHLEKTGGTITGDITLGENTSIALDPAGSADGKYTGITITGTAGAALAFGDLIYLAAVDSRWELCDADAAATGGPVLVGMCVLAAAGDASATKILLQGQIRADAKFPALTISAPVYLGETAGAIQVAIPTGADNVIRVVGWALTADELYFNPSAEWQITVA